ncbi:uncharacterized protein LOC129579543 [Sitodiplosis mosellana]|uniref:uncharacterized protein LOC129579543 n=1 Tax=Sitodiplosis mosellana TaxID=263140 RepID=UPI002444C9E6|nr:uncharacterized protein LOC129579543 [Sitodiplosis mosellana]
MSVVTNSDGIASRRLTRPTSNEAQMNLYDCIACRLLNIDEKDMKKHHQKRHADIPIDQNIFKLVEFHTIQLKFFDCVICNARDIIENDTKNHHLKQHKDIPIERNIFKLSTVREKSVRKVASFEQRLTSATNESLNIAVNRILATTSRHSAGPIADSKAVQQTLDHLHPVDNEMSNDPSLNSGESIGKCEANSGQKSATIEIEIFKCTVCGLSGLWKSHLWKHQKKRHRGISLNQNIFEFIYVKERRVRSDAKEPKQPMTARYIDALNMNRDDPKYGSTSQDLSPQSVLEPTSSQCVAFVLPSLHRRAVQQNMGQYHPAADETPNSLSRNKEVSNANFDAEVSNKEVNDNIEVELFKCTVCGTGGLWKSHLSKHHQRQHKKIPRDQDIFELTHVKQRKKPVPQSVKKLAALKMKHDDLKNQSDLLAPSIPEGPRKYGNAEYIQVRRYTCVACDLKVAECHLKAHHKKVHPTEPYTDLYALCDSEDKIHCLTCDKMILQEFFESHMHLRHMPKTPVMGVEVKIFTCKLCHRKDIQEEDLSVHHSSMHQNVPFDTKNFREFKRGQCIICEQLFKKKKLRNHVKIHSEIAIVVNAPISDNQSDSSKEHNSDRCEWIVLKPFNCKICGVKSFKTCSESLCTNSDVRNLNNKHAICKILFMVVFFIH